MTDITSVMLRVREGHQWMARTGERAQLRAVVATHLGYSPSMTWASSADCDRSRLPGCDASTRTTGSGFEMLALDVLPEEVPASQDGRVPLSEPVLLKKLDSGRLRFTTSSEKVGVFEDLHFVCVRAPQQNGPFAGDPCRVDAAFAVLAPRTPARWVLVVDRATVSAGTAEQHAQLVADRPGAGLRLTSPEFRGRALPLETATSTGCSLGCGLARPGSSCGRHSDRSSRAARAPRRHRRWSPTSRLSEACPLGAGAAHVVATGTRPAMPELVSLHRPAAVNP